MEFEGNRQELYEMASDVSKVAKNTLPIDFLRGIYLEADEQSGKVSMLGTNYEAAISTHTKASIAKSGKIVLESSLLRNILALLPGEHVHFSTNENRTVKISSLKNVYNIHYLSAEGYPKPLIPFPGEMIKLKGLQSLIHKAVTVTDTGKDNNIPCVNLRIANNSAYAVSYDLARVLLIKGEAQYAGTKNLLIPTDSLKTLSALISDRDEIGLGIVGKEVVFVKNKMIFTTHLVEKPFVEANDILQKINPKYKAEVNAELMKNALDLILIGKTHSPVNIVFLKDSIKLICKDDVSEFVNEVPARVSMETPTDGFYYNAKWLFDVFKFLIGTVEILIDENGFMLAKSTTEILMQSNKRKPVEKAIKTNEKAA